MTVTLEALDFSRPVQLLFEQAARTGVIHSVFPKALNIVVGDTLFVLLSSEVSRMPNGARLPAFVIEQLYEKLSPGMEVCIGNGELSIAAPDLSIRLPARAAWEPVPMIQAKSWYRTIVAHHAHLIAQYLAQRSRQDGLAPLVKPLLLHQPTRETPLATIALPLLRLLMQASRQGDRAGVERAARGLAGLGPGLTPSGDDTLGGFVGVLALSPLLPHNRHDSNQRGHPDDSCRGGGGADDGRGRLRRPLSQGMSGQKQDAGDASIPSQPDPTPAPTVWRRHPQNKKFLATIIANAARPRTTMLSAALLAHAARGELAEHVGDLLKALTLPVEEADVVLRAAERVLAYGAWSGGDTLLGLLLGLQASGIDYPIDDTGEDYGHTGATQAEYVL